MLEGKVDRILLEKIQRGNLQSFGDFYDRHSPTLFAIAIEILQAQKKAEDLLQEVFIQIWHRANEYDPAFGKPISWLISVTRNKAIDWLRLSKSQTLWIEEDPLISKCGLPYEAHEANSFPDELTLFREVLATILPEERQAIDLAYWKGLTQTEIAFHLGQPIGTIKARIRRGMVKLSSALRRTDTSREGVLGISVSEKPRSQQLPAPR